MFAGYEITEHGTPLLCLDVFPCSYPTEAEALAAAATVQGKKVEVRPAKTERELIDYYRRAARRAR